MSTMAFLRDVARRPLQMGAILPSGPALAREMVDAAGVRPGDSVLELGAGSGAFTREIVRRHPQNPLVLVELSPALAAGLRRDHPQAHVVEGAAEDLPAHLAALAIGPFQRVVSGLPWALWPRARQERVLDALLPSLGDDATFVTFHYVHSRAMGRVADTRALLSARFTEVTYSEPVWANAPPALVHIARIPARGAQASASRGDA
jgi:phospholipid N-methyltransferase